VELLWRLLAQTAEHPRLAIGAVPLDASATFPGRPTVDDEAAFDFD
jgi:hypothetical protein